MKTDAIAVASPKPRELSRVPESKLIITDNQVTDWWGTIGKKERISPPDRNRKSGGDASDQQTSTTSNAKAGR